MMGTTEASRRFTGVEREAAQRVYEILAEDARVGRADLILEVGAVFAEARGDLEVLRWAVSNSGRERVHELRTELRQKCASVRPNVVNLLDYLEREGIVRIEHHVVYPGPRFPKESPWS